MTDEDYCADERQAVEESQEAVAEATAEVKEAYEDYALAMSAMTLACGAAAAQGGANIPVDLGCAVALAVAWDALDDLEDAGAKLGEAMSDLNDDREALEECIKECLEFANPITPNTPPR